MKFVICPHCGQKTPVNIENKNASCVGLSIRCKGRHCKKIIPIVIKDGEQVEPM